MRLRRLTAYTIRVPLKRAFRHASAERIESENVVARCELADGTIGWGEGVPRSYVTGETPEGCLIQLASSRLSDQLTNDCTSWAEVIALCERFELAEVADNPRGCYGNALRCAVELSVLDAFGRLFGEPISRIVEHLPQAQAIRKHSDQVRYSTTIDAESNDRLWRSALKMRVYGFRQCKVKVGVAGQSDVERLRIIRRWLGSRVDIRVDANEAWPVERLTERSEAIRPFNVSCIEQPCPHEQLAELAQLRPKLGMPIMLDESLTSRADAERAIALRACDLFNIRLSKCGGYLRSLELAAIAHENGLGYQLGCHPGETGILSAAGRHWATSVRGIRYWEGSYDRHVLRENVTREDVTFGYGGIARALNGLGLGVTVDPQAIQRLATRSESFDF
ncbi:MAG: dipeptide epimerase [Pirellulales bacterium]